MPFVENRKWLRERLRLEADPELPWRRFRPATIARGPRFRSELRHRIAFEVER
jgi:hypothetical protein